MLRSPLEPSPQFPVEHALDQRHSTIRADGMLLVAAAIWGSGFIAQRAAMSDIGPFTFNTARYLIGAVVVLPIVLVIGARAKTVGIWRDGVLLGTVLALGAGLQQAGLVYTSASRGGFITGLYVLAVPVFALMLGHRPTRGNLIGVLLATIGLLMFRPSETGQWLGDGLVLASALVWGLQVVLIGKVAPRHEPMKLSMIQFLVAGVLSMPAMLIGHWFGMSAGIEAVSEAWVPILYSGIAATGIAYTLQVVAQRTAPPTHATVLLSLEAVFAATLGWLILHERLGPAEILGAALMMAGALASQLIRPRRAPQAKSDRDPTR